MIIAWISFSIFQYWVCRNSCANAYWKGKGRRSNCGINNFNTICEMGPFWCLLPIVGFLATYSFITSNQNVRWDAITLKYIPEAWN